MVSKGCAVGAGEDLRVMFKDIFMYHTCGVGFYALTFCTVRIVK